MTMTDMSAILLWNVGETAWCKTNTAIGPMRKWRFVNTDSQSCFLEVFSKQYKSRFALLLQIIYNLINLILLLDMVL